MLKKTITYEDLNGKTRTEDFYFDISKSELIDLEMKYEEGFEAHMHRIINAVNKKELYDAFTEMIQLSYGEKSEDGRYFQKESDAGAPLYKKFLRSPAYDELLIEFLTVPGAVDEFVSGILPNQEELERIAKEAEKTSQAYSVKPGQSPVQGLRPVK